MGFKYFNNHQFRQSSVYHLQIWIHDHAAILYMGLEMCLTLKHTSQDHINYEPASFQSLLLDSVSAGLSHPHSTEGTKKHWDASRAFHDTILLETQTHPTPPRPAAQLIWCLATRPSRLAQHHGKPPLAPGCSLPFSVTSPHHAAYLGLSLLWSRTDCHLLSLLGTATSQYTGAAKHDWDARKIIYAHSTMYTNDKYGQQKHTQTGFRGNI